LNGKNFSSSKIFCTKQLRFKDDPEPAQRAKPVTGKHYDGADVEDLREPLQRIANEIERLMLHGIGAKVIEIGTAKQAA